jgi:hypothetical protein
MGACALIAGILALLLKETAPLKVKRDAERRDSRRQKLQKEVAA